MRVRRRDFLGVAAAAAAQGQTPPARQSASRPASPGRRFTGEALREIAFPLGGLGTGTVSLGGFGNLRDWEIFNRPNKGCTLPFTFAAVRLAGGGLAKPMVRVIERQPLPPFTGQSGVPRESALGLPRFRDAAFTGSYPIATIEFRDPRVPVTVALEAFNPMAPLDADASGLPVAILTYRFTSRAASALDLAVAFSLMNPVGYDGVASLRSRRAAYFGQNLNEFQREGPLAGMALSSKKYETNSPRFGSMALVTDAADVSWRAEWEHGPWWDEFQKWWDEFLDRGRFANLQSKPSEDGATEHATLAAHLALEPRETKQVTFVLGWHFPNVENHWTRELDLRAQPLRNYYGTQWTSAWDAAAHALTNLGVLRKRTVEYRDRMYSSTLPAAVIDAVSSQASIARTNTVMVLEGKRALAFEGCNDHSGCCPMNCTHVYNYEQSLAHLYPELERSMREIDFLNNMRPDGSMSFRTPVPLQPGGNRTHPAADGQMGCVMKVYREWRLCGDDAWLRKLWPAMKRAIEYAWKSWDADRDGVMEGEQHNTYDIEFYGPNTMMGTLYLGALAAASKMAGQVGDTEAAARYQELFEKGRDSLDQQLWNGEYYVQKVDENQEKAKKYQYGEGCLSDQLLGQWFAEVVGLGPLLPAEHIRSALAAIYKYNYRQSFEDFPNAQRLYALNDERGLLLCSWPHGKRPELPFVYSDEVWTGIEYQVAAHLCYEGMTKEGLAIVQAVRDRYDGARRNPWNEIECGHHYARAMSSWSLLTALSGYRYSAADGEVRFRPAINIANFRCLFTTGSAWGTYRQWEQGGVMQVELDVAEGSLTLKRGQFHTALPIEFKTPVELKPGDKLSLKLRA